MKIDRLIGILAILLQKDTVTAPDLARHFEVSRRTINRDIEDLCQAGIPIATRQGQGGGIYIMDGYRMDRTLLTNVEMQDILAGLRSLDSINGTNRYGQLMEKLSAGSSDFLTGNQSVLIDLSSWYKSSLAPKIETIRSSIDSAVELSFLYYAPKGESQRTIEPYYLIFRWSSWYVWGWCLQREDFRLFKLNRMEEVRLTGKKFEKRKTPMPDLSNERIFPGGIQVKALFEPECKWRLVEEFGPECFKEQEDGRLLFQADYTDKENLVTWIMSFRDKAEVLEPDWIREEIRESIEKMLGKYERRKFMGNLSCCGTDCQSCGCYGSMCKGCNESAGKVFHAPEGQACPIYECSVNQKKYQGCGECGNVPCEIWRKTKDPSYSDEEFEKNISERVDRLKGGKNGI